MISNDARRMVAKKLRESKDDYESAPAWSVIDCGELPASIDEAFYACGIPRAAHATEILARLADLIEPEPETDRCDRDALLKLADLLDENAERLRALPSCTFIGATPGHEEYISNEIRKACGAKVVERWPA